MSKSELRDMVGGFLAQGMDYDECLQVNEDTGKYDAEASAAAQQFFNKCESGTDKYQAFVEVFFG